MSHTLNDTHAQGYKIFLQSKDATIVSGSTVFFFLHKVITPPDPSMDLMVGIVDIEIPCSFYNINANNNKITINGYDIALVLQNYSAFNIKDTLNSALASAEPAIPVVVDFSQQSNKFTFSPTENPGTVKIDGGTLCDSLGLTQSQVGLTPSTSPIIGNNCCNLAGTANIYVSSNFNINNLNSTGQYSGVLAKVLVNAPSGEYIFYQPSQAAMHVVSNKSTSNIVISLLDDNLAAIDLNGLDFSLTLSVEFCYKRETKSYTKFLLNDVKPQEEDADHMSTGEKIVPVKK